MARYLEQPASAVDDHLPSDPAIFAAQLCTGDVLLVEGKRRISVAIKYLTHSNWSHAALYVGPGLGQSESGEELSFVEADAVHGVCAVAMSEYAGHTLRICRPSGLTADDAKVVCDYAIRRIGYRYDLRNVVDLARYLLPMPPVPSRTRRRMIALGSGEPTRAICSTLIAEAFQSVRYPILPVIEKAQAWDAAHARRIKEQWRIRHHSLFVPADFDASPFFDIVKPESITLGDYRSLPWADSGETPPYAIASAGDQVGPRVARRPS